MGMVWDQESDSNDFKAVQLGRNGFPSLYLSFLIYRTEMEGSLSLGPWL